MANKHLIRQLPLPDYISLLAVFLSWIAIALLFVNLFFISLSVAILALIADMLDGWLARKRGVVSLFGRHIDSLADVVLYLLYPSLFLLVIGLQDLVSVVAIGVFIAAGLLRLARFTVDGLVKKNDQHQYVGMPVFWNLFWIYIVFIASLYWPISKLQGLIVIWLLVVCWLMMSSKKFPKPENHIILIFLLLVLAMASFVIEVSSL